MSNLDGATTAPPENTHISNPGEFAARWNAFTEDQRQQWVDAMRESSRISMRCFMEQHERNEDAYAAGYADAEAHWSKALNDV